MILSTQHAPPSLLLSHHDFQDQNAFEISDPAEQKHTTNIYITNLPKDMDDNTLYALGSACGTVISHKAMLDKATGTCKGFGFLMYATHPEAKFAIDWLSAHGFLSSFAKESFTARLRRMADCSSTNVYLSNLPVKFTVHQLEQLFSPHPIASLKILKDVNGESRGVGFVRLLDRATAEQCIQRLHGRVLPGTTQPLQVRFADSEAQRRLKETVQPKKTLDTLVASSPNSLSGLQLHLGPGLVPGQPQYQHQTGPLTTSPVGQQKQTQGHGHPDPFATSSPSIFVPAPEQQDVDLLSKLHLLDQGHERIVQQNSLAPKTAGTTPPLSPNGSFDSDTSMPSPPRPKTTHFGTEQGQAALGSASLVAQGLASDVALQPASAGVSASSSTSSASSTSSNHAQQASVSAPAPATAPIHSTPATTAIYPAHSPFYSLNQAISARLEELRLAGLELGLGLGVGVGAGHHPAPDTRQQTSFGAERGGQMWPQQAINLVSPPVNSFVGAMTASPQLHQQFPMQMQMHSPSMAMPAQMPFSMPMSMSMPQHQHQHYSTANLYSPPMYASSSFGAPSPMSPFAGRAPGYANTQQHQAAFHHSQRQSPLLSPAFEHLEGGLQGGDWRNSHSHSGMQPSARGWSQDELAAYSRQETLAKARGLNFSFQTSNASTGLGLVEQAQGGVRQTSASAGTDADSERVSPPYLHPHAGSSGTAKKPSALGGRRESGKSLRAVSDPMPQGFSTSNGRHQHRRNVISSSSKAQSWRRGSIGVGLDARRVAVSADNSLDLGRVDDDYDHENEAEIEIGIEASVGDDSTTSRTAPDAINTTQLISHHRPRPRTSQSSGNSIDIDNSHPLIGSESGCDEEDDDDEKDDHDSEGDNSIEIQINPSSGSGFGHSHGATFSTSGKNGTFTLLPIRTPSLPTL